MEIKITESQIIVKTENDQVQCYPTSALTDFLQIKPCCDPLLPQRCRYFAMHEYSKYRFVIEDEPQIRTIRVNDPKLVVNAFHKFKSLKIPSANDYYRKDQTYFTLSFPYTIYIIDVVLSRDRGAILNEIRIFFRTSPLRSLRDYVYRLPILNRYHNGRICMNSVTGITLNEVVSNTIESFWSSEFNGEVDLALMREIPVVNNLFEWDYMTKKDPLFILNLNLHASFSLSTIVHNSDFNFRSMVNLLSTPKVHDTASQLIHDSGDFLEIGDYEIYRGDVLEFPNIELEVISFVTRSGDSQPYIYGRVGNRKSIFKLTKAFQDAICKILEKTQIRSVSRDGKTFSVGDIFTGHPLQNCYYQISSIKPSLMGNNDYRVVCGNKMFMLSDFSKLTQKIDLSKYIGDVFVRSTQSGPVQYGKKATIKQAVCKNNYIYLDDNKDRTFNIDRLTPLNQLHPIPPGPFKITSRIVMLNNGYKDKEKGAILITDKDNEVNFECSDEFFLRGCDIDLSFKKGDKVVYADGKPEKRLEVHEIVDIQGTQDSVNFTICSLLTRQKQQITYVKDSKIVLLGLLRKVVLEYEGVSAGSRIVCKRNRIPCFPKKDINEIVAFVVDHVSEPLVLCSNGCTIWWSVLSASFEVLNKTSKAYSKELAPIKRIRFQTGDLVCTDDNVGWYYCDSVRDLDNIFSYVPCGVDSPIVGIPEPRVPVKYTTNPNFHKPGYSLGHGTFYVNDGFTQMLDHNKLKKEMFDV